MKEIIIRTQEEWDKLDKDYDGIVYFENGQNWIIIKENKGYRRIVKNSSVEARENSSVEAWENSSVVAWENSSVEARENSSVVARENSSVVARENSSVEAWENSSVEAWENSSVVARENSSVVARENSSVEAWENSSVEAWENSSVEAWGNTQIVDITETHNINITGNSRIVYMPKTIDEFIDFYGIKRKGNNKAIFYKAVRKSGNIYYSDYNEDFTYEIGKKKTEICDQNILEECSYGIHISYLDWALRYGLNFDNLAILEIETEIDKIVLPKNSNGKVRTSEIKVLREVPLSECGIYGKIIEKRRKRNGNN